MPYANGRLYTCDICGKIYFCRSIGEEETDGGYTRWNKFEPLPEGWRAQYLGSVDEEILCDVCAAALDTAVEETKHRLMLESRREKEVANDETESDNNRGSSTVQIEEA